MGRIWSDVSGADGKSLMQLAYSCNGHIQGFKTQRSATKTNQPQFTQSESTMSQPEANIERELVE